MDLKNRRRRQKINMEKEERKKCTNGFSKSQSESGSDTFSIDGLALKWFTVQENILQSQLVVNLS